MSNDKSYSIFEILVFILFFPIILIGWVIRFIISRRKLKKAEEQELHKIELLEKIANKVAEN